VMTQQHSEPLAVTGASNGKFQLPITQHLQKLISNG
jgi:hypothetical protein